MEDFHRQRHHERLGAVTAPLDARALRAATAGALARDQLDEGNREGAPFVRLHADEGAAPLALGESLYHAVELSLSFVHRAIEAAPQLGSGNGPLNHFV